MTEDFIQYLWRFRLLCTDLVTVTGEKITILHPGESNRNGGPDFFNARLRIGQTTWAGNVEIHQKSSDWFRHGHDQDHAYDNVILHVVDSHDIDVTATGTKPIPVVEVRGNYPERVYKRYLHLLSSPLFIPCQNLLKEELIESYLLWVPVLAFERLEEKAMKTRQLLVFAHGNWEEAFYQSLGYAVGLRVNAQPFELLAKSLPLKLLFRHRSDRLVLEALLFGQAGLLHPVFREEYPRQLHRDFCFFNDKYCLTPLKEGMWKFLRMRPSGFPTVRISQFAGILQGRDYLFEESLLDQPMKDWMSWLEVKASDYWDTHYTFERISVRREKFLGKRSVLLIMINAVAPFLFLSEQEKNLSGNREKAIAMLEELPAEEDADINQWKLLGFPGTNAMQTQALKQLKSRYCDQKRCLECRIGAKVLR
ncbi:MAG: DUF2851 family protein [bacterium]